MHASNIQNFRGGERHRNGSGPGLRHRRNATTGRQGGHVRAGASGTERPGGRGDHAGDCAFGGIHRFPGRAPDGGTALARGRHGGRGQRAGGQPGAPGATAVPDRSAPVPGCPGYRAGAAASGAGAGRPGADGLRSRRAPGVHGRGLAQGPRRGCIDAARPAGTGAGRQGSGRGGAARPVVRAHHRADCRARRPGHGDRGQPGQRRHGGRGHTADHHRVDRSHARLLRR